LRPLVTIITPVYNGERYLKATVESVLQQTYPNIEYIVLDDGSTDNTADILRQYPNLQWQTHANMGQAKTINKGWEIAKGEYLAYLSADDILFPNAIQEVVELLINDPDCVVAFPNCDLISQTGEITRKAVARPFDYNKLVFRQECFIGPGAIVRRSAFEKVGGWNPQFRLAPDRELWMRLGLCGKFAMCNKVLAYYRIHAGSASSSRSGLESVNEPIQIMESYFSRDDLPNDIIENKNKAMSRAYFLSGRIYLKARQFKKCWEQLKKAKYYDRHLNMPAVFTVLLKNFAAFEARHCIWSLYDFFKNKKMIKE
jgi:glycosyltransferase involved in cell wall biosynthesis